MKTLWALVAVLIASVTSKVAAAVKDDKVHHKRQLDHNFGAGGIGFPLDFPYGPIDLGHEYDFYSNQPRIFHEPQFNGWPNNGLYGSPDFGHAYGYANGFNYLPPSQDRPLQLPPPPPPPPHPGASGIPIRPPPPPPINLNTNPIIVDENQVDNDDVIREVPPPNLNPAGDSGVIQRIPSNNRDVPAYGIQAPVFRKVPPSPYPSLEGNQNEYLPPFNQGFPLTNPYLYNLPPYLPPPPLYRGSFPRQPQQSEDVIPVQEPGGPEPYFIPPQLYRPAVSNPAPVVINGRNRTANTLVPTAPVSLGSGSLGIVRLNNGQYALGSGSLGYVGNQQPFPQQSYLNPQPAQQPELYEGQRPQTFTIQQQPQQVQGQFAIETNTNTNNRNNQDDNQQQNVNNLQPVIPIGTNRHRPFFGPVQLAPGLPSGGYGLGTDGRLGFIPTNLYQNLPSIQHLGEPEVINNNKFDLKL